MKYLRTLRTISIRDLMLFTAFAAIFFAALAARWRKEQQESFRRGEEAAKWIKEQAARDATATRQSEGEKAADGEPVTNLDQ